MSNLTVVYGGSFNPVHRGHVAAASMIAADPEVGRVLVIPAAAHPEKSDLVAFETRYWLLKLAMPEDNKLRVCRAEQDMLDHGHKGPVFTMSLMSYLGDVHGNYQNLRFAVGPDIFEAPSKWYVAVEETYGLYTLPSFGAARSTEIRRRVKKGLPIDNFTPTPVADEIARQRLYM